MANPNPIPREPSDSLKNAMVQAMVKSLGVVTTAARAVGISRQTHYKWLQDDPEYKTEIEDTAEVALDFAESQLHKQIEDGQPASTIFFLKTKGKKRGYVERTEQEHLFPESIRIIRDQNI